MLWLRTIFLFVSILQGSNLLLLKSQAGSLDDLDYSRYFQFVQVRPGTFTMGSPVDEAGRDDAEIPHNVTITRPFWIQTTPVTQSLWLRLSAYNPSYFKGTDRPVENVSWLQAQDFAKKLTTFRNDGYNYRLPTEAEWEFAARAGTETAYFFGADSADLTRYGWFSRNSNWETHPVAQKEPNPLGLYDLYGNVGQWVSDYFKVNYYEVALSLPNEDPCGPDCGSRRVLRGGNYASEPGAVRSASRSGATPTTRYPWIGFRLVREKTAAPEMGVKHEKFKNRGTFSSPAKIGLTPEELAILEEQMKRASKAGYGVLAELPPGGEKMKLSKALDWLDRMRPSVRSVTPDDLEKIGKEADYILSLLPKTQTSSNQTKESRPPTDGNKGSFSPPKTSRRPQFFDTPNPSAPPDSIMPGEGKRVTP